QLVEASDLKGDGSEGARDHPALLEDVGAEATQAFHAEGEVEAQLAVQPRPLILAHHLEAEGAGLGRGEVRGPQGHELAVDSKLRRRARGDVEIRGALLEHRLEQLAERKTEGLAVV